MNRHRILVRLVPLVVFSVSVTFLSANIAGGFDGAGLLAAIIAVVSLFILVDNA